MTAPARVPGTTGRTRTTKAQPPQRERGTGTSTQPDRTRSAAAERAYARRAQRSQRATGTQPDTTAERKSGSAGRVTFVVLVIALLIGGVVATLWFATQATADAYNLEQAKNTTSQLQARVGQLQQQVAQQNSPLSLQQRAHQLGMIPAPDPAHIVVGKNGKATVIGTPSAAVPPPPPTTAPPTTTPSKPPANSTSPTTPGTTATPPTGG